METRYREKIARLRAAALESPGELTLEQRRACFESRPPALLAAYIDKVSRHAYKVTDADIDALREAGLSEDEIFEATVSAAVGAGLSRLERGLEALRS